MGKTPNLTPKWSARAWGPDRGTGPLIRLPLAGADLDHAGDCIDRVMAG
jgi:hypothetical protein